MKLQFFNPKPTTSNDSGWILIFLTLLIPIFIIGVVFVVDFANAHLIKQKVRISADAALNAAGNLWKKDRAIREEASQLEAKLEEFYLANLKINELEASRIIKDPNVKSYEWDPDKKIFTIRPKYQAYRFLGPIIGLLTGGDTEHLKNQDLLFTSKYRVDEIGPIILGIAFDISNFKGNPHVDISGFDQIIDALKYTLDQIPPGNYVTLNTANHYWVDLSEFDSNKAARVKQRCIKNVNRDTSLNTDERNQALTDCNQFTDNWIFDATEVVETKEEEILNPEPNQAPAATKETLIAKVNAIKKFARPRRGTHVQGLIARGRKAITDLKGKISPEDYEGARKVLVVVSDGLMNASSSAYCLENDLPGDDDDVNCFVDGYQIPAETTCNDPKSGAPLAAKEADLARKDGIIIFSVCVAGCAESNLWSKFDEDGDGFCDPIIDPNNGQQKKEEALAKEAAQKLGAMKRISNVGTTNFELDGLKSWWKTGPDRPGNWPGLREKNGQIFGRAFRDDRNCGWYTREIACDRNPVTGAYIPSSCQEDNGESLDAVTADPDFRNPDGTPLIPDEWPIAIIDDPDLLAHTTGNGEKPPRCYNGKRTDEYDFSEVGKQLEATMDQILKIVQSPEDQLIQ